jgi:hypothetical protein
MIAAGEESGVSILGTGLGLKKSPKRPGAVFPGGDEDRGLTRVVETGRFVRRVGARRQKAHQDVEATMPQCRHEGGLVEVGIEAVHVRPLCDEAADRVLVAFANGVVQAILEAGRSTRRPAQGRDLRGAGGLGDGEGGDSEVVSMSDVGSALDEEPNRLRLVLGGDEESGLPFVVGEVGVGARGGARTISALRRRRAAAPFPRSRP